MGWEDILKNVDLILFRNRWDRLREWVGYYNEIGTYSDKDGSIQDTIQFINLNLEKADKTDDINEHTKLLDSVKQKFKERNVVWPFKGAYD